MLMLGREPGAGAARRPGLAISLRGAGGVAADISIIILGAATVDGRLALASSVADFYYVSPSGAAARLFAGRRPKAAIFATTWGFGAMRMRRLRWLPALYRPAFR